MAGIAADTTTKLQSDTDSSAVRHTRWCTGVGSRHAGLVTLSAEDRLDITELLVRYAEIIDEREFSRAGEVFTDDASYDVSDFGMGIVHGHSAIAELWRGSDSHPLAHHVTNVEILDDEAAADEAGESAPGECSTRVRSRIIGVGAGGRVGSASYHDVVVRSPAGWRIASRVVTLRTPDRIPPPT